MPGDPELRRLLWYLLGSTVGGENRAKIINELRNRPSNLNQLANKLGAEYRTVRHHVDVLLKNSLLTSQGAHYGLTYFLSQWLESRIDIFDEICRKLKFSAESNT